MARVLSGVLVLLVLSGTLAAAQSNPAIDPSRLIINVKGKLLNEYQQPMQGVEVKFTPSTGAEPLRAVVDEKGDFVLDNVRPGTYTVGLGFEGFEFTPTTKDAPAPTVDIKADGTIVPDLLTALRQATGAEPGMWKEILLFFGIAATGGAAAL